MCTSIESLGLRNRKRTKTIATINKLQNDRVWSEKSSECSPECRSEYIPECSSEYSPKCSSESSSERSSEFNFEYSIADFNPAAHLPASYYTPPKGTRISCAYDHDNVIVDEETNLVQSFYKNFTAEEQEFLKPIIKQTKNHYLASGIASLLGISPFAFSLLYLASLFAQGDAQFASGMQSFQSNHSFDFTFEEGPINGTNLCQGVSRDIMCTELSMLKNGSIVLQTVSKIDTDFGFVFGDDQATRLRAAYIENLKNACIKAFKICRNFTFIEKRISSVIENSTDISSLFGNATCIDSGIIGNEDCQTQTVFTGLSQLGCNKILGINNISDISVLRQCTDMIRDETRIKDLATIFTVVFSICGATCLSYLAYQLRGYCKEKRKEQEPLMQCQAIIEKQFETAIALRNLEIIPDDIMQLMLEYSYPIHPKSFNNFHKHLSLKLNALILQKIEQPLSKKEKSKCIKALSASTLIAFHQFDHYKYNCRVHKVPAMNEVEMLKLKKDKQPEEQEQEQEAIIDIKEQEDLTPLMRRTGVSI